MYVRACMNMQYYRNSHNNNNNLSVRAPSDMTLDPTHGNFDELSWTLFYTFHSLISAIRRYCGWQFLPSRHTHTGNINISVRRMCGTYVSLHRGPDAECDGDI